MLKKTILAVALLLPLAAQAQEIKKTNVAGDLNWTVQASWPLPAKPLDLVHSLDNKKVFILTADNKVHIFAADGRKLGEMEVELVQLIHRHRLDQFQYLVAAMEIAAKVDVQPAETIFRSVLDSQGFHPALLERRLLRERTQRMA